MKRNCIVFLFLLALILPGTAQASISDVSDAVEVPIIMYHKITKDGGQLGKFAITPGEFEADLQFLRDSGYEAVTMADLIRFVHEGEKLPERPIVLTFDDGYFSDYLYLFPLLKQYDTRAVSSIIGRVTDEYTAEGREDILYPHLLWSQIVEMVESGLVEIQNHGYDLHCTRGGSSGAKRRRGESEAAFAKRLSDDLMQLQVRAEDILGTAPNTFTYPFGAKSDGTDAILKSVGFSASLMTEGKRNTLTPRDADCLFSLGRINRPHGRSLEAILAD